MADMMYNAYSFKFGTEIDAEQFYNLLINWCQLTPPIDIKWHGVWLGKFVIGADLDEWDDKKSEFKNKTFCAGSLDYSELECDGTVVSFKTETKWDPDRQLWECIAEKYAKGAEVLYSSASENDYILETNDDNLAGTYIVDIQDEDELAELIDEEKLSEIKILLGHDTYCSDVSLHKLKNIAMLLCKGTTSVNDLDMMELVEIASGYNIKVNVWEKKEFITKEVAAF